MSPKSKLRSRPSQGAKTNPCGSLTQAARFGCRTLWPDTKEQDSGGVLLKKFEWFNPGAGLVAVCQSRDRLPARQPPQSVHFSVHE